MENRSVKDILAGLAFIGFGLAFGIAALGYEIGTALRMGPGYFPLVLAAILVLIGIAITVGGFRAAGAEDAIGPVPWRGLVFLLGSLVFFGVTIRGLGLVPSLFGTALIAALASRFNGPASAIAIAAALTLLCWLIFIRGLGISLPVFGPWIGS